ncbi:MAG: DUF421 domain-containing protein [Clostridia bacterium]
MAWTHMLTAVWRTAVLWAVALSVFRLMGKRTLGKMGAFDIAVIIMLGEATAIGIEDTKMPLVEPIAVIFVLGLLQWLLTFFNVRIPFLERITQGIATLVIDKGTVKQDAMLRERLSQADLEMELRQAGTSSTSEVEKAYLEPTGRVSVVKVSGGSSSSSSSSAGG